MKTIYKLMILERDDYFRSNNQLVCKILNVDENDVQIVETITIVDRAEKSRTKTTKVKVDGEYKSINSNWGGELFDSLEEVKQYIEDEYELVKSTKHWFYFLTIDNFYNDVIVIANYKDSGFTCSDDFVDLQKLLNLSL